MSRAAAHFRRPLPVPSAARPTLFTARATLETAVKSIIARRREIQFAAAAQWPPSNPANAGIRREFRLSPDKAMK